MKTKIIIQTLVLFVLLANLVNGHEKFYAYHTKVSHSATDYFGKYADLIVVMGEGKQLEFTRRTQNLPKWVTSNGEYMIDDFHPERDFDYNFEYNYVKLLEECSDKIVVHWRYIPNLKIIKKANEELNPTVIEGFTHVVHEIFVIHPDGKIEREIKNGTGSRYESWVKKDYADRQTILLKENGVEHGKVIWGNKRGEPVSTDEKNPIISAKTLTEPLVSFSFDEGGYGFPFEIEDEEEWEFANSTVESISEEFAEVSGHMMVYKKGVSGTSLGFDGYYTGIAFDSEETEEMNEFTLEAWIALDVYPFNEAPVIHQSKKFGVEGYYLGIDAYGKLFLRVNNKVIKSSETLPLYKWKHISATLKDGIAILYLDGNRVGSISYPGNLKTNNTDITIGLNTEKARSTDYVRDFDQNIPFIHGFQGLIDEVKIYDKVLSVKQIEDHYITFLPDNRTSPLKKAVLPGEVGVAEKFSAIYKNLEHHELWDKMWRNIEETDIVVKFDHSPVSVVYWRGTNFAANWVTDNNRWMADQSSEIFTKHGCSEHMSDKQTRHSYARIIEANDARVIVHWRYPCVDVGYVCIDRMNWTDEYHTIYPDATAIRKVVYNNSTTEAPGFQDVQYFTNPGETALDVVDLNAVTVANVNGDVDQMIWEKPNKNPQTDLNDATIQYINTKSLWKVYALYPEPGIGTWGSFEQSKYTDDPFAGPWNHWPISVVPSDGRFAVAHDRVTHFALGAGDSGPKNIVHYGFTDKEILSLVPSARYWQNPPEVHEVTGGQFKRFSQEEKAFIFESTNNNSFNFKISADSDSPVVNPAFVLKNCKSDKIKVTVNGKNIKSGNNYRTGIEYDTNGLPQTVVWLKFSSEEKTKIEIHL